MKRGYLNCRNVLYFQFISNTYLGLENARFTDVALPQSCSKLVVSFGHYLSDRPCSVKLESN